MHTDRMSEGPEPECARHSEPMRFLWRSILFLMLAIPSVARAQSVSSYLQYPNYRGMLWSDQSQVVKLQLSLSLPAGYSLAEVKILAQLLRSDGTVAVSATYAPPPAAQFIASLDASGLPEGTYTVQETMQDRSGTLFTTQQPAPFSPQPYRVTVQSAAHRSAKMWIDQNQHFHYGPSAPAAFPIVIYDMNSAGCSSTPSYYSSELKNLRAAPGIDGFVDTSENGCAPLADHHALATEADTFSAPQLNLWSAISSDYVGDSYCPAQLAASFADSASCSSQAGVDQLVRDFAAGLSSMSNLGYYVADEPYQNCAAGQPECQSTVYHQYQQIKAADPFSLTFAAMNPSNISCCWAPGVLTDESSWRDNFDIFATDPYGVNSWSQDGAGNYEISPIVADWTTDALNAVQRARPVLVITQFYPGAGVNLFPTQQQMYSAAWTAIVAGANGLGFWAYGEQAGGGTLTDGTTLSATQLYQLLSNVSASLAAISEVLLSPDAAGVVTSQTAASKQIVYRTKQLNGEQWVFAYNYTGTTLSDTFTLASAPSHITVYGENRTLSPSANSFSDSFPPYSAHAYQIAAGSAQLKITPAQVVFGREVFGATRQTSPPHYVTLWNPSGTETIDLEDIELEGDFSKSSQCLGPLPPKSRCHLPLRFTPTAAGLRTGTLIAVQNNGRTSRVKLSGRGALAQLSTSPRALGFPTVTVGSPPVTKNITLTNRNPVAIAIQSIISSDPGQFETSQNCLGDLPANGATCRISISFAPGSAGAHTATLTIKGTMLGSPHTLKLFGLGRTSR